MNASPLVAACDGSLEDAAIALAQSEQPQVDPQTIRAALDALAAPIRFPPAASLFDRTARLAHRLFHELGFRGDADEFDAPRNSYIDRVLERRRGLPITLSIVTIAVGERVDLPFDAIGFPGHFLVAPRGGDPRFFVDPFHGGMVHSEDQLRLKLARQRQVLDEDAFASALAPTTTREVLLRMCNNLALSYVRRRDRAGAARMLAHLVALDSPHGPIVQRLQRLLTSSDGD